MPFRRILPFLLLSTLALTGLDACKRADKKEPETLDVKAVPPSSAVVSQLLKEQDALADLCPAEKTQEGLYDCIEKEKIKGMGTSVQRKEDLLVVQTAEHALFIRNKPGASYHFVGYLPSIHQFIIHQIYNGGASFTFVDQNTAKSTPLEGNPTDKATVAFDPTGQRLFDFYPGTSKVAGVMRVLEFDSYDGFKKPGAALPLCGDTGNSSKVAARWLDATHVELTTLGKSGKKTCSMDITSAVAPAAKPVAAPLPVIAKPEIAPDKAAKAKAKSKAKPKAKAAK